MKQELIYQAILSTLAHEATDEEQKIVDEWLRESEENREEYEGMRRMYEKATAPRKPKQFDADRAWKQVADHTIYKKKSWYLSMWVRYAAVVAVVVASGLFFITDWFRADSLDGIDMMAYNEPTLLLEGGDEIDLSGRSFIDIVLDQCFVESRIVRRVLFPADTGVTFLHIRGYAFGAFLVGGSERKVVGRYTGKYFRVDDSFADIERLCLCNDFVVAVEEDWKNIQLQCFCQVESSFVETLHLSVVSACTFGEDSDGVALFYFFPHPFHILLVAFAYVIEIDIADDCSEERRMPYPMVGYHQDFRRKRQQYQNIDERLVVGDNNCRMLKTFVSFVDMFFFDGSGQ